MHVSEFVIRDAEDKLQSACVQPRTVVVAECIRSGIANASGIQSRKCVKEAVAVILKPEDQNM